MILRGPIHDNDLGVPFLESDKIQNSIQGRTQPFLFVVGRNDCDDVGRSIEKRFPLVSRKSFNRQF